MEGGKAEELEEEALPLSGLSCLDKDCLCILMIQDGIVMTNEFSDTTRQERFKTSWVPERPK